MNVSENRWTVGEVARFAGVSVRALHYYDHVGLLRPSQRSPSGYRLYTDEDLDALQRVLIWRELGFGLAAIDDLMSDVADRRRALQDQRELLAAEVLRLTRVLNLVESTLTELDGGPHMTHPERFEGLGGFDPTQYDAEVAQRWGDTDAARESARRTAAYSQDDWTQIKAGMDASLASMAELLDAGVPGDDPRAMAAAEQARLFINDRFYPCDHAMHSTLADMYMSDERFTATYERVRPGLAKFVHDAIVANGERAERGGAS